MTQKRDHGGGLDQAIQEFGGTRDNWLDLSTGINPIAYPIRDIPSHFWQALPDSSAQNNLIATARDFWAINEELAILPSSGVSQLICMLPKLAPSSGVHITKPTYNEHEASFLNSGWHLATHADAQVFVHPNNPDGRLFDEAEIEYTKNKLTVIDESFCDVTPENSLSYLAKNDGVIVLKGLGKFWGLAGLRLGFAIAKPETIQQLQSLIGPWAISGPAQFVGAQALQDKNWAQETRQRLAQDSAKLDALMNSIGIPAIGGTDLFRLYETSNAETMQAKLATKMVWSRRFPYSKTWLRLGLPGSQDEWRQLSFALGLL